MQKEEEKKSKVSQRDRSELRDGPYGSVTDGGATRAGRST